MGLRSSLNFGVVFLVVEVVEVVGVVGARVVVCSEGFEMVEAKAEEVQEWMSSTVAEEAMVEVKLENLKRWSNFAFTNLSLIQVVI